MVTVDGMKAMFFNVTVAPRLGGGTAAGCGLLAAELPQAPSNTIRTATRKR
jgi:hypothetical protein